MLLRRGFGHQQAEQHGDGLAVGGVEGDGLREADERRQRLLQALDAAVRHGNALAQRRRPEALAREQAVEHQRTRQAVIVFEEQAGLLERAFLARGEHV